MRLRAEAFVTSHVGQNVNSVPWNRIQIPRSAGSSPVFRPASPRLRRAVFFPIRKEKWRRGWDWPRRVGGATHSRCARPISARELAPSNSVLTPPSQPRCVCRFASRNLPFARSANGGEGGIRTHGTLSGTPDFESGTIDHSATSPLSDPPSPRLRKAGRENVGRAFENGRRKSLRTTTCRPGASRDEPPGRFSSYPRVPQA